MNKLHVFLLVACFFASATTLPHACRSAHEGSRAAAICKIKELPNGKAVSRLKTVQDVIDAQEYLSAESENASDEAKQEIAKLAEILENRKKQLIETEAKKNVALTSATMPEVTKEIETMIQQIIGSTVASVKQHEAEINRLFKGQ